MTVERQMDFILKHKGFFKSSANLAVTSGILKLWSKGKPKKIIIVTDIISISNGVFISFLKVVLISKSWHKF